MDFEKNDGNLEEREQLEFERKLRAAMRREDAPLGLKTRVLAEARKRRQAQGRRWWQAFSSGPMLQRMAASVVIAGAVGGFAVYHQMEERAAEQRRGEEAKAQVMAAFRITNKALDRVQERLADDSR